MSMANLKQTCFLWFTGFKEACCLHRVFILCFRSSDLSIRAGQCFLLNGLIFLGSVFVLKSFLIPTLEWILPDHCPHDKFREQCVYGLILRLYSTLRIWLIQLLYVFWFYPLYAFSIVLSTLWYNDIAKHAFITMGQSKPAVDLADQSETSNSEKAISNDKPAGFEGVMIGIGEQVYSMLLLNCFFLEVSATGIIPFVGKPINFVLLSWMYAYYCFEYKWNLSGVSLDKRLDFFESHWAFFAGFGSPCVLAIFFFPPLESYAVMATLFPLFVLTATGSEADHLINSQRTKWPGGGLARLPVFYVANTVSMKILSFLPFRSKEQTCHTQ
ncbi:hypothetical protein V2J09_016241 [Rumex salicifolius]